MALGGWGGLAWCGRSGDAVAPVVSEWEPGMDPAEMGCRQSHVEEAGLSDVDTDTDSFVGRASPAPTFAAMCEPEASLEMIPT